MKKNHTVLIVEDDLLSAEYLKEILIREEFDVLAIIDNGEEAIRKCKTVKADIILMDIVLKGQLSGCEAAVEIKHEHPKCNIIFLTAFADPEMIDYAADAKAAAYLMKPYREQEILATIRVVLAQDRRPSETEETGLIPLKRGFVFDSKRIALYRDGKEIPLTSKKLKFIELMAKNKNHMVSSEQICQHVWNEPKSSSTLRSLIYRFRSEIGDDIITNVSGAGYSITS